MPFSADHLKVIVKIETAVLRGGLFAMAMPRGSGKTTLCETACLWAMTGGYHPFVYLIGNSEDAALAMLGNLKSELSNNDALAGDYPEICYPIRALENQARRCLGQLHHGAPTHVAWLADGLTLPMIPGSRAGGSIVRATGLTGNIRGAVHTTADGRSIRPSLVILDDPQTDQSARSLSQCVQRETIIAGAVLGLAGPGKRIAAVMPCTVIQADDLADRLLNHKLHPDWQGERTRLVYSFPTAQSLWDEYAIRRAEGLASGGDAREATEFYRTNREAMDKGALVAWEHRHFPNELSAIQHAMNLQLRDPRAFWSEYQNDPLPDDTGERDALTAAQIAGKVNGHDRGVIPHSASRLTMFVDVQKPALFWLLCAWEDDFTGYIVAYGTEPERGQAYFTLREIKRTLAVATPKAGLEGSIYAGLERLAARTIGVEWRRDDGTTLRVDRCLIDANWGQSTDVVYQFCRQTSHAANVTPSHGKYIGAASMPMGHYQRKRGDRIGLNWRIPVGTGKRAVRYVLFDTNFWKSFINSRLRVAMGDPGCLSLFGRQPEGHRLLADHLTAEFSVKTEGRGRTVDEWRLRAPGLDNHWFDCLVGCAVAASMGGAALQGTGGGAAAPSSGRKRISLAALAAKAR